MCGSHDWINHDDYGPWNSVSRIQGVVHLLYSCFSKSYVDDRVGKDGLK